MKSTIATDITVIGAGVVGTAIARSLSAFAVDVTLIDAESDVGAGTSKANTAILHTGFDATPGSLEARLVRRGYELMKDYAEDAGIPVEPIGGMLVAWTDDEKARLPEIDEKAQRNEIMTLVPVDAATLYRLEPNLGPGALGGLLVPGESIVCPYTPVLAYATEAVRNGTRLLLETRVDAVTREGDRYRLRSERHDILTRWVVNAAGLHSDTVDNLFGFRRFTVTPRRGELIVFDKFARRLMKHILLPVPTKKTKGVLVSPTVFGNLLLGPTAEDIDDKTATGTTSAGLRALREKGARILPALADEEITATYAGLRAATENSDFSLHVELSDRYVCVGGIRSTGLTASLGIAEHVVEQLIVPLQLREKPSLAPVPMPYLGNKRKRPHEDSAKIAANPDYGRIVCHCERVSRGELVDALAAVVPARTLDGLRRRTRCLQGRCQGFYCLAPVTELLEEGRRS